MTLVADMTDNMYCVYSTCKLALRSRIAIFNEIEDKIIDFRARYVNADLCIMVDLNIKTGIADYFL